MSSLRTLLKSRHIPRKHGVHVLGPRFHVVDVIEVQDCHSLGPGIIKTFATYVTRHCLCHSFCSFNASRVHFSPPDVSTQAPLPPEVLASCRLPGHEKGCRPLINALQKRTPHSPPPRPYFCCSETALALSSEGKPLGQTAWPSSSPNSKDVSKLNRQQPSVTARCASILSILLTYVQKAHAMRKD